MALCGQDALVKSVTVEALEWAGANLESGRVSYLNDNSGTLRLFPNGVAALKVQAKIKEILGKAQHIDLGEHADFLLGSGRPVVEELANLGHVLIGFIGGGEKRRPKALWAAGSKKRLVEFQESMMVATGKKKDIVVNTKLHYILCHVPELQHSLNSVCAVDLSIPYIHPVRRDPIPQVNESDVPPSSPAEAQPPMMHPARSKISVYGMRENLKALEKRFRMLETQILDVNVGKKKPIVLTALRGVAQETGALAFDMGIQGMVHVFGETNQASSASKYLEQVAHSVVEVDCGAKLDSLNMRYGGNVLEQIAKTTGSVVIRATKLEGEDAINTVLISRGRRDVGSVSVAHDQLLSLLNRISEVTVGNRVPLVTEKFKEIAEQTDCILGHDNKDTAFIAGGYNQVEEAMNQIADVMDTCEEVRIGMVLPAVLNESSEEIIEIAENTGTRIVADSEKLVFVLSGSEIQREAAKAELTKISECMFERRLGIRLCDSLRDQFNEVAERTGARVRVHR